jgi:tight adherence protein B
VDLPMLCGELAAVMRAGSPPFAAWQALAERRGPQARLCRQVLAAARPPQGPARGGPLRDAGTGTGLAAAVRVVAAEVRAAGGRDGSGPLRWLALGLAVSDRSGAPMADVLGRLTVALRAEAAAEADRAAVMAGPRATAAVLSLLPVAGVGLGVLIGADPVRALVTMPAGRGCLVVGLLLWAVGVWWASALLRRAERAGSGP